MQLHRNRRRGDDDNRAPPPNTAVTTTTTALTTATASAATTTSTTIAATTTVGTIDPDGAQIDIEEVGDRWIASHDVIRDQVKASREASLAVVTEYDSTQAPVFATDEGHIPAPCATLALCVWADAGTSPQTILDTIMTGP